MIDDRKMIYQIQSFILEPPLEYSPFCLCGHKEEDHWETVERGEDDQIKKECRLCKCESFNENKD